MATRGGVVEGHSDLSHVCFQVFSGAQMQKKPSVYTFAHTMFYI